MAVEPVTQSKGKTSPERHWPPQQGEWTYDEYVRLPDNGMRYEVIEGDLYMAPAPRPRHQRTISALHGRMWEYLRRQPIGEVIPSPIDLILPGLANPVQPDLLFIAKERLDMIKESFIEGVPDLVVEVLYPGSVDHDRRKKFELYSRAGVREYWIVDPDQHAIDVYVLRGHAYAPLGKFETGDQAYSEILTGFSVLVEEIVS